MSDDIDYDPKYAGCEHPDSYALVDTLEELEALRAELTEQARLVGMGAERELKLIAERDEARGEVAAIVALVKAKVSEWENQASKAFNEAKNPTKYAIAKHTARQFTDLATAIEARAYVKENDGD